MPGFRLALGTDHGDFLLFFLAALSKFLHNFLIRLRVEQFSENHFFLIGFCPQQFHKFPLGDHSNLHKLSLGQSQNLHQFLIRFLLILGKFCLIW